MTRDAQGIAQARSTAREASRAARWPSLTERMLYALICWLPIALLIGYAGSIVTGCDRASVTCPPYLETVQSLLIAFSLGLLVALPRLAYTGALATVGMLAAAMAVVIGTWLVGLRPPLPLPVLVVVAVVLVIVYLATANWALNDGPRRRPWMNEMRSWRELRR